MPTNPPENMPRITPNIFYDDVAAALEWLEKAFAFETRSKIDGEDGSIIHAEMSVVDSVVMLTPASDNAHWAPPKAVGGRVPQALYIYVDDVDAHHTRACSAGAEIAAEPEDAFWGDRTYVAVDPEGHRWTFAQVVRDPHAG